MTLKAFVLGVSLLASAKSVSAIAVQNLAKNLTIPVELATASYVSKYTFNSANFYSSFNFFTGSDPTHGFVSYQSQAAAQAQGLVNTNNGQIYLGVDHTTVNPGGSGRNSVRVTSNQAFTHGLFIADIAHMPGDICGVWPAFWLFGPNWPASGEIDIIEGVNLAGSDQITLHTAPGCNMNVAGSRAGTTLLTPDCNSNSGNNGCGVTTSVANSYGNGFNNIGGGVYAMQWESSGLYIWFFPRNAIPADITNNAPVTGNWGLPVRPSTIVHGIMLTLF